MRRGDVWEYSTKRIGRVWNYQTSVYRNDEHIRSDYHDLFVTRRYIARRAKKHYYRKVRRDERVARQDARHTGRVRFR